MSQGANPCSSSAVAIDSILKSYKDIRQQQKDIFHALNWCLGGCMEEWEWSLSLCEYSLKVLQSEPHFLILFCCIKMVTVAMCLLCLPSAVCGAVHRPAVLILQSRGIQRPEIESVVHISPLYRTCSVFEAGTWIPRTCGHISGLNCFIGTWVWRIMVWHEIVGKIGWMYVESRE